jgi:F-type H+-transporting ATPase subunit gamma
MMLVLSANRGLCGGYNGNVLRMAAIRRNELAEIVKGNPQVEVSGKRGISGLKFRKIDVAQSFTQFDDQPKYSEVEEIANTYLRKYIAGEIDRLDVVYTRFVTVAKQVTVVETLLPLGKLDDAPSADSRSSKSSAASLYEFLPSAESILEEVVPTSFKVKLFKCFLDAAVSEQIARMVAMKNATKSASDMIKDLSRTYNRARQSQITGEIMEVIGGVEALKS